jgi:hypothetical protein
MKTKLHLAALALACVLTPSLMAQSFTAAIRGVVTDASGAAVPGAKVTVTEADRNIPHPVSTDEAGALHADRRSQRVPQIRAGPL